MRPHPSTPPAAFYLLAAGVALAVLSLILVVADARTGLWTLTLGVSLGLVVATTLTVAGARQRWDRSKR